MAVVQKPPAPAPPPWYRRIPVVTLLGALLTFVGLAVVTGIGIASLRLETIGMSAKDTVTELGPDHLVEVGAYQLAVFALAGGLAVGASWAIARHGTALGHQITATWLAVAGLVVAVMSLRASSTPRLVAVLLLAAGGTCLTVIALTRGSGRVHRWLHRHGWAALLVAAALAATVVGVLWDTHEKVAAGVFVVVAFSSGLLILLAVASAESPTNRFLRFLVRVADGARRLLTVVSILLMGGVLSVLIGTWWMLGLTVIAGLLALRLRRTPGEARPFRRYTVEVFGAVLLFGSVLVVVHAAVDPGARPVAVLDGGGKEIVGIYVGRTGASHLVAVGPHCSRDKNLQLQPGRLKRESATLLPIGGGDIRIGDPTPLAKVFEKANQQLDELRKRAGLPPRPAAAQCQDEGPVDLAVRASAPVPPPLARALAAKYRPVLRFDSDERWRPLNVERLVSERVDGRPIHSRCAENGECTPVRDVSDLVAGAGAGALDLYGSELGGGDYARPDLEACPVPQPRELRDCDGGPATAIYYNAQRANGRTYIDYWWFLRYNHFSRYGAQELCRNRSLRGFGSLGCLEHEGDWEGLTAVTAVGDAHHLEYVDYAAHEGVYRRRRGELELVGQRPRVYVAEGSHAGYPAACPRKCPQVAQIAFGFHVPEDNTNGNGDWARNSDASCNRRPRCLLPLPATSWNAFPDRWGSQSCVSGSASCRLAVPPETPAAQRRYRTPWCYTDERKGGVRCDPGDIDRRPPG